MKSQPQDSSREEDGGYEMTCLKQCGLGVCQIRGNPKSPSAPWNDSDSDCFGQSIPKSKQQGNVTCKTNGVQNFYKVSLNRDKSSSKQQF